MNSWQSACSCDSSFRELGSSPRTTVRPVGGPWRAHLRRRVDADRERLWVGEAQRRTGLDTDLQVRARPQVAVHMAQHRLVMLAVERDVGEYRVRVDAVAVELQRGAGVLC